MGIMFGEYLMSEKKIDTNQLREALKIQMDLKFKEHYKMLGEILSEEMHVIDENEMNALLENFGKLDD